MYAKPLKLKEFRKEKHLTQEEIANLLFIEYTAYGKIQRGVNGLSYQIALKLCSILEKQIHEFSTYVAPPTSFVH